MVHRAFHAWHSLKVEIWQRDIQCPMPLVDISDISLERWILCALNSRTKTVPFGGYSFASRAGAGGSTAEAWRGTHGLSRIAGKILKAHTAAKLQFTKKILTGSLWSPWSKRSLQLERQSLTHFHAFSQIFSTGDPWTYVAFRGLDHVMWVHGFLRNFVSRAVWRKQGWDSQKVRKLTCTSDMKWLSHCECP